jgi:hypothetical protein
MLWLFDIHVFYVKLNKCAPASLYTSTKKAELFTQQRMLIGLLLPSHFNLLDNLILLLVQVLQLTFLISENFILFHYNFRLSTVYTIFIFRHLDCVVSHV